MDIVNDFGVDGIDEITDDLIEDFGQLLISKNLKETLDPKLIQHANELNGDEETETVSFLESRDRELSYKELRKSTDKKRYIEIFKKVPLHHNAVMIANRGLKAMAAHNMPYGVHIDHKYELENADYELMNRLQLHRDIIPLNEVQCCRYCNVQMDPYGEHAFHCRYGYNQISHHDAEIDYIGKQQNNEYQIETEPRVKNSDDSGKRPDIAYHSKVEVQGKQRNIVADLEIANIFNKKNITNIEQGTVKIFGAGLAAEEHKNRMYASNQCQELLDKGYLFQAWAMENYGGVGKNMYKVCNSWLNLKANNKAKGKAVKKLKLKYKNNFWIRFNIYFVKQMLRRVRDHYILQ